MKIFIDSADIREIEELSGTGLIDGVTTNPSLIAKSGNEIIDTVREICDIIPGPVSAEVTATDHKTMMIEAEKLSNEIAIINDGQIIKHGDTKSIIREVSLNTIEIELVNVSELSLPKNIDYEINGNILKIQSQEVNKDIVKIIELVEKTTKIENINIINSSLEDAFLKLTN